MRTRVLIVDDHQMLRRAVRGMLESHAHFDVIAEAENGEEAIQIARQLKPDLIIMDVNMPVRSGFSAATEIRKSWPEIKIIIFSSYHVPAFTKAAQDLGLEGYVTKTEGGVGLFEAIDAVSRNQTYFASHSSACKPQ